MQASSVFGIDQLSAVVALPPLPNHPLHSMQSGAALEKAAGTRNHFMLLCVSKVLLRQNSKFSSDVSTTLPFPEEVLQKTERFRFRTFRFDFPSVTLLSSLSGTLSLRFELISGAFCVSLRYACRCLFTFGVYRVRS